MATHSSILARRVPWTEEPGRHPEVLSGPALQSVSQLPGCLTVLPYWSLVPFSSTGESGTQTLSCTNPSHRPQSRGHVKDLGTKSSRL